MTPHETTRPLLALSAAGLLDPEQDRQVRAHVAECPECAATLDDLARLASALAALPSPVPPRRLMAATRAQVAAELARRHDRKSGAILALAGCASGWILSIAAWNVWDAIGGNPAILIWLEFSAVLAGLATAAVVRRRRRVERSF